MSYNQWDAILSKINPTGAQLIPATVVAAVGNTVDVSIGGTTVPNIRCAGGLIPQANDKVWLLRQGATVIALPAGTAGWRKGSLSIAPDTGYGALELSGPSGAYIDFKDSSSEDNDARIIYNSGGGLTLTATGVNVSQGELQAGSLVFDRYQNWSGGGAAGGAEIANDNDAYKALMIVGNNSAGGSRIVKLWDNLTVNNNLTVVGALTGSGNASVAGTFSAGATTLSSLTVNGNIAIGNSSRWYQFDSDTGWMSPADGQIRGYANNQHVISIGTDGIGPASNAKSIYMRADQTGYGRIYENYGFRYESNAGTHPMSTNRALIVSTATGWWNSTMTDGVVYAAPLYGATGLDAYWQASPQDASLYYLGYWTSKESDKTAFEAFDKDRHSVLDLTPVVYRRYMQKMGKRIKEDGTEETWMEKDPDHTDHKELGLTAEEVAEKFLLGATLDTEGSPASWNVRSLVVALLAEVKENRARIEALEAAAT